MQIKINQVHVTFENKRVFGCMKNSICPHNIQWSISISVIALF